MAEKLFKEVKQSLGKVIKKLENSPENFELSKESFLELDLMLIDIRNLMKSFQYRINRLKKHELFFPNINADLKSILEVKEYQIGSYKLNTTTRMLTRFDKSIKLTKKEMQLLAFFCKYNNVLVKRSDCLTLIWSENSYGTARSMDVYLCRLRKYLKDDASIYIINIHGSGYRMIS